MTSARDPLETTRPIRIGGGRGISYNAAIRAAVAITLAGFFIFTVGTKPGWLGLDRSPAVGFIQISVFLFGLAIICVGGLWGLTTLWNGMQRTIVSDIGMRLVGTGYVISVFSGMADVLGFGSQPLPQTPYFGPVEAAGVVIGQAVTAIGFLMLIPYKSLIEKDTKDQS